jgi:hypothetical protein
LYFSIHIALGKTSHSYDSGQKVVVPLGGDRVEIVSSRSVVNVDVCRKVQNQILLDMPIRVTVAVETIAAAIVNRTGSLRWIVGVNVKIKRVSGGDVGDDNHVGSMSHL